MSAISTPSIHGTGCRTVALPLIWGAVVAACLSFGGGFAIAADEAKVDPHYPFRTDWANQQLPWYQPKPLEFPPHHSDHRAGGELIAADYIHRTGMMRMGNGEIVSFTMPPYASVYYLNAEADLRDVPLGTFFLFFLNQDPQGAFTVLATMQDEYTMLANHGFSYRLTEYKRDERKLLVVKQKLGETPTDVGKNELLVDDRTRVWKGDKQIALTDISVGDALLVSLGSTTQQKPRHCTEIWVGAETHKAVTEAHRRQHVAFLKERGLPAWITSVDGRTITVTLFSSEPASLQGLFKDEGIDPALWAKEHRSIHVVVADENLRSYWPPVTKKGATVREFQTVPTDCYGCSGVRWVIEVDQMLEGFRVGRNVRLFVHPSWPVNDMPFGEGLHQGGHDIDEPPEAREVVAVDFPYRTDFGNPQLPWYRLQAGKFPPDHSEHVVVASLVRTNEDHRSATFKLDHGGDTLQLVQPPFGVVLFHGHEADLQDVPLGTRCRLSLHADAQGAFTQASVISDDFSWFFDNTATYRLEEPRLDEGRLFVAHQVEPVKVDYHLEPLQAPDFGRAELLVDGQTKVWKGDHQIALGDLVVGDVLLVDIGASGRCSDIWVGADTHKMVREQQRTMHRSAVKERGVAAYIDTIDGKRLSLSFFAGIRADFPGLLSGEPRGKKVFVIPVDDRLRATGAMEAMAFADRLPEGDTTNATGCSGIRWMVEAAKPESFHVGDVIRMYKDGWPIPAVGTPPIK
jgi:hypothetical protein